MTDAVHEAKFILKRLPSEKIGTDEKLGLAHGYAGIAYFLNYLYQLTGDGAIKKSIAVLIRDIINDQRNVAWSTISWCNGLPGIILLLSRLNESQNYTHFIKSKVNSLEDMSIGCNFHCLCHGLAGIGDVILEINRINKIRASKDYIIKFLEYDAAINNTNYYDFEIGRDPAKLNPSFMVGLPGIGHFILRHLDANTPYFLP